MFIGVIFRKVSFLLDCMEVVYDVEQILNIVLQLLLGGTDVIV
jgi:protoheme ferro-lyase